MAKKETITRILNLPNSIGLKPLIENNNLKRLK